MDARSLSWDFHHPSSDRNQSPIMDLQKLALALKESV